MKSKLKDGRIVGIREVEITDATLLLEYFERVNLESKNLLREPGEYTFTIHDEKKYIRNILKSNNECAFVALYDNSILASAGFRSSHLQRITHRASIGMSVIKDFHNLGLGTKLLEVVIEKAKEMNKKKLELEVRADNLSAVHLYEKFGFEIEGTIKSGFFVDQKYIDLLLMGKLL